MKFSKEKTSGSFGRDICLSGLAGLLFELVSINENTLVNDSIFNTHSINFLFARTDKKLAIYVKSLKNLYLFKKDNDDLWEEDSVDKNIECRHILLTDEGVVLNDFKFK